LANGYKSALRRENYKGVESFLLTANGVLLSTTDLTGKQVCDGKRKICILGFLFNIESLLGLGKVLLFEPSPVQ